MVRLFCTDCGTPIKMSRPSPSRPIRCPRCEEETKTTLPVPLRTFFSAPPSPPLLYLPIVQLTPQAPESLQILLSGIVPDSVIVATHTPAGLQLDYEGGIYTRPSSRPPSPTERRTYAQCAAGRAAQRYPTTARLWIDLPPRGSLAIIGWVHLPTWAVVWLPTTPPPVFPLLPQT